MPHCMAFGCSNHSGRLPKGIKLFPFPRERNLARRWVIKMGTDVGGIECFLDSVLGDKKADRFRLCSEHFSQDQFKRDMQAELTGSTPKKLLNDAAIPSIFAHKQPALPRSSSENVLAKLDKKRKSTASDETTEKAELVASTLTEQLAVAVKTELAASTLVEHLAVAVKTELEGFTSAEQLAVVGSTSAEQLAVKTELAASTLVEHLAVAVTTELEGFTSAEQLAVVGSTSAEQLAAAVKTELVRSTSVQHLTATVKTEVPEDISSSALDSTLSHVSRALHRETNKIDSAAGRLVHEQRDIMPPQVKPVIQIVPNSTYKPCNESTANIQEIIKTDKGVEYSAQLEYPDLSITHASEKVLNECSVELLHPSVSDTIRVNDIQYEVCKACNGTGFVIVVIQNETSNVNTEVENVDVSDCTTTRNPKKTKIRRNNFIKHSHSQVLDNADSSHAAEADKKIESSVSSLQIKLEPSDPDTVEMVDMTIAESINRTKYISDIHSAHVLCEQSDQQIQEDRVPELHTPLPSDMSLVNSAQIQEPISDLIEQYTTGIQPEIIQLCGSSSPLQADDSESLEHLDLHLNFSRLEES